MPHTHSIYTPIDEPPPAGHTPHTPYPSPGSGIPRSAPYSNTVARLIINQSIVARAREKIDC